MKQTIYFIPGLGANCKIFERLQFDQNYFNLEYLEWIEPHKNETFDSYINRFSKSITENMPILIGVSFGGIIAQEIGKKINCEKIYIVSSIKSEKDFSPTMKTFKYIKAYKLFPSKYVSTLLKWGNMFSPQSSIGKKTRLYNTYLTQRSNYYLDWSMKMILNWKNEKPLKNIIHIQGTKDHIFPLRYIKNNVIEIKNGTHAMILFKGREISNIIQQTINQ